MTDPEPAPVELESLQAVVDELEFVGVEFYAFEGQRNEDVATSDNEDDSEADVRMDRVYRRLPHGLDYRAKVTVSFSKATIRVDAAAVFRSSSTVNISRDLAVQFGEDVAIMSLFPYIREAVADIGSRLGFQTQLPLLRRGGPFPPPSGE